VCYPKAVTIRLGMARRVRARNVEVRLVTAVKAYRGAEWPGEALSGVSWLGLVGLGNSRQSRYGKVW